MISKMKMAAAVAVLTLMASPVAAAEGKAYTIAPPSESAVQGQRPQAPPVAFISAAKGQVSLDDFRGRVVLLNLWATFCPPCVDEMPALDNVQKALGSQGLEVVAVSYDFGGALAVQRFYDDYGIKHLGIYTDPAMKVQKAFEARGLPTTIILDRQGREVWRLAGAANWDSAAFVQFLRKVLAEKN